MVLFQNIIHGSYAFFADELLFVYNGAMNLVAEDAGRRVFAKDEAVVFNKNFQRVFSLYAQLFANFFWNNYSAYGVNTSHDSCVAFYFFVGRGYILLKNDMCVFDKDFKSAFGFDAKSVAKFFGDNDSVKIIYVSDNTCRFHVNSSFVIE